MMQAAGGRRPSKIGMALALLAVALLVWVSVKAVAFTPSFDGAMNLQVSWSLAQGDGYRRTYADRKPFPREVQSNVPLTVPAALVYKAFGMGRTQSQAVNLLYLYALVALGFTLVARRFGSLAGACAALMLVVTPGVAFEGLKGYGEVPALVWTLAALCLLPVRDGQRWRASTLLLAGTCFGLALATKTVIAICVAAFGLCIALAVLADVRERRTRRLCLCMLLALGVAAPLLAIEAWRLAAPGGLPAYHAWWLDQWNAINAQTGTRTAPEGLTGYVAKGATHLAALGRFHALAPVLALPWLLLPFLASAMAATVHGLSRRHLPLVALLLAVALYFGWWLLLAPDNKVWHRRILDGCLMLNLAWVYVAAWLLEGGHASRRLRVAGWAATLVSFALFVVFTCGKFLPTLTGPGSSVDYARAIALVRALPPDAALYGLGWNSAPHISLLAERPFGDFNDLVPAEADRRQPAYLVLDAPGLGAGSHRLATGTYVSEPLMPGAKRAQVYRLDLSRLVPPGSRDVVVAQAFVSFADGPYPPSGGIGQAGAGGRWLAPEAFVRLRYDGSDDVLLQTTTPSPDTYRNKAPITVSLDLDGCDLGTHPVDHGAGKSLRLPIPERCRPAEGLLATLRVAASDVLDQYIGHSGRALSLVALTIGFAPGCESAKPCPLPTSRPRVAGPLQSSPMGMLRGRTPVPVCGSAEPMALEVEWNASSGRAERVDLLVRDVDGSSKLWTKRQPAVGHKRTGPWMRPGMAIVLSAPDGTLMDQLEYSVPPCDAGVHDERN